MAADPDLPSSWSADETAPKRSRLPLIVAGVVVVAVVVGGALLIAEKSKPEPKRDWPASANLRPPGLGSGDAKAADVKVDAQPGVYVWSDFQGWHLWVVNGGKVAGVKGTITSDKDFANATSAIKGAGSVKLSGDTITLDLPASPGLVGVDFNTGFYAKHMHFDLTGQAGALDPALVAKGSKPTKVDAVPFDIDKVLAKDAATS